MSELIRRNKRKNDEDIVDLEINQIANKYNFISSFKYPLAITNVVQTTSKYSDEVQKFLDDNKKYIYDLKPLVSARPQEL